MTMVICTTCGKENQPAGNWNYCRGCGGRLELPVAQATVLAAEGDSEAVTATAAPPAAARRNYATESAPRRKKHHHDHPPAKALHPEMRWWTYGLILGLGLVGMLLGAALKEQGVDYSLANDPFVIGMLGGFLLGGLIAQVLIWLKQGQHE